jgi:hypothetical protein
MFKENIKKIRERCEASGLNHCSIELSVGDKLWWFKNDSSIKFDHWTGVDFLEEEIYDNGYIQELVNKNIVDALNQIDQKTYIKKGNSIKNR